MKYFFCTILLALAFVSLGQAFTEKILGNGQSNACFGAAEVNGDLYFSLTNADEYFGISKSFVVYHADASLNIIDSVDLTTHNGAVEFNINKFDKSF